METVLPPGQSEDDFYKIRIEKKINPGWRKITSSFGRIAEIMKVYPEDTMDDWSIGWYCIQNFQAQNELVAMPPSPPNVEVFFPRTQRTKKSPPQPLKPLFRDISLLGLIRWYICEMYIMPVALLTLLDGRGSFMFPSAMIATRLLSPRGGEIRSPYRVGEKVKFISGLSKGIKEWSLNWSLPVNGFVYFSKFSRPTEVEINEDDVDFSAHPIGTE